MQAEADLGLMVWLVGLHQQIQYQLVALHKCSRSRQPTINVPDKPYMFGEGVTHPATGVEGFGAFDTTRGYIFDPTVDSLEVVMVTI